MVCGTWLFSTDLGWSWGVGLSRYDGRSPMNLARKRIGSTQGPVTHCLRSRLCVVALRSMALSILNPSCSDSAIWRHIRRRIEQYEPTSSDVMEGVASRPCHGTSSSNAHHVHARNGSIRNQEQHREEWSGIENDLFGSPFGHNPWILCRYLVRSNVRTLKAYLGTLPIDRH